MSGIDLSTEIVDVFTALLGEKAKNVSKATHVFYFDKSLQQSLAT